MLLVTLAPARMIPRDDPALNGDGWQFAPLLADRSVRRR
jgi:hypothetical protein